MHVFFFTVLSYTLHYLELVLSCYDWCLTFCCGFYLFCCPFPVGFCPVLGLLTFKNPWKWYLHMLPIIPLTMFWVGNLVSKLPSKLTYKKSPEQAFGLPGLSVLSSVYSTLKCSILDILQIWNSFGKIKAWYL